jgi:integrase
MVVLMYRAGLRCREVCRQELADVVRRQGGVEIRVSAPKGMERGAPHRRVGLDPKARRLLDAWIDVRRPAASVYLFPTHTGQAPQTSYVRRLLPELARKAGIQGRVHPHGLRHTFAAELYREGFDLLQIMQLLGHRSLLVTQDYLRTLGCDPAVEANAKREW